MVVFKCVSLFTEKMVVVANEPYAETEPMLSAGSSDDINWNIRRNSLAEEAYRSLTRYTYYFSTFRFTFLWFSKSRKF